MSLHPEVLEFETDGKSLAYVSAISDRIFYGDELPDEDYDKRYHDFEAALNELNSEVRQLMDIKNPRQYLATYIRENLDLFH